MPRVYDEEEVKEPTQKLGTMPLRVLRILERAEGPLTMRKVAEILGTSYTYVARAIGPEDDERRLKMDAGLVQGGKVTTLVTLGAVDKYVMDIDGLREVGYEVSDKGRELLEANKDVVIPDFVPRKLKRGGDEEAESETYAEPTNEEDAE